MARYGSAANSSVIRWGISREPVWTDGTEATSPTGGTVLVTVKAAANLTGRCYGVSISAPEANIFQLGVVNAAGAFTVIKDFQLGSQGTIFVVVPYPIIGTLNATGSVVAGSSIQVRVVTTASSSSAYQASIFTDQG